MGGGADTAAGLSSPASGAGGAATAAGRGAAGGRTAAGRSATGGAGTARAAAAASAVNAFISVPGLRGGALAPSMSLRDHASAYAEPKKAAESAGGLLRACCRKKF